MGSAQVAIIGGGYAGMAAAVSLAERGLPAIVFEAGATLGGRARRVIAGGIDLDNGLHILIGAYGETQRIISIVGQSMEDPKLLRIPLELGIHPGFRLRAPRLPWPINLALGLLTASGIGTKDKIRIVRMLMFLRSRRFLLDEDVSVAHLLAAHHQTHAANLYLWHPLCISALNTAPDEASAQIFCNVLRDTFSFPASNSDLLLPLTDLSRLFPEGAVQYVARAGGEVRLNNRVTRIASHDNSIEISTRDGAAHFKACILAVAPQHLCALIEDTPAFSEMAAQVAALQYRPIYSVYLAYPENIRLPKAMVGLYAAYSQWVFDRGRLCNQPGVLGVVISAAGSHQDLAHDELASRVHGELRTAFPHLPAPLWHRVIAEKRATFACTVGIKRPSTFTPVPGVFLAGDYVHSDYPATIEAAVRSGLRAAHYCAQNLENNS
ncbi:MAG: FAD-dependent oxidoreductase [Betaproteobacteria bacterium]|nr:FAD-dependent oxidoreductase [Betaproteobacteria bacterium]